jgi:putative membrane protein
MIAGLGLRRASGLGLLAGLAVLTGLVAWQGLETVSASLAGAGWRMFWLPAFFLLPLALATASWLFLYPAGAGPRPLRALHISWVGLAVNWLLPVAQVGGELARARLLLRRRQPLAETVASLVGDKTLQVLTQIVYTLLGLGLYVGGYAAGELALGVLLGVGLFTGLVAGFYRLQHAGLFALFARLAAKLMRSASRADIHAGAEEVDGAVRAMYRRRLRLAGAALLRLGFRLALAGEVYLALAFLGHPVSILDALILESLGQAMRAAAFLIPGGLGAQEGMFMAVAAALGIPTELGLAVSLGKRLRELTLGIPGLLALQLEEVRGALGGNPGGDGG